MGLRVSRSVIDGFEGFKMWLPWILRSREFVAGFLMIADSFIFLMLGLHY